MKKISESAWGDMRKRSTGKQMRKEDEIPQDIQEALAAYIDMFASFEYTGEYTVGSYPDFRAFIKDFQNKPRIMKIDFDMEQLLDYVESHWDVVLHTILDAIDKVNTTVDDIIDKLNNPGVNESAWGDMRKRSSGEIVRKEDDLTSDDVKYVIKEFASSIVYFENYENTFDDFEKFMKDGWHLFDDKAREYVQKQIDYVRRNWDKGNVFKKTIDEIINMIEENIKKLGFEKEPGKTIDATLDDWWNSLGDFEKEDVLTARGVEDDYTFPDDMWSDLNWEEKMTEYVECNNTNESAWGDMRKRSSGEIVRKEDILDDNEIHAANELITMYCRHERVNYIQHKIVPPPPSRRKENDLLGLVKYIEVWRDFDSFKDSFKDIDFNKIIKYIKNNWEILDIDKFIKKWIFSPKTMEGKKVFECEGVPGGATPANVGGMGAAYFPGPDGTPGSGDLPSPTGIVYHQVAPYTMFLKQIKKKKKKSKKFRKEDEPCVHSPNVKVYDYVDDFREYVDRTYNQMDRRK